MAKDYFAAYQKAKASRGMSTNMDDPQGIGPNAAGIVGSTLGQIIGTPFDVISGPGGTMAGGAIGGGIFGGGEDLLSQLLAGHGIDWGKIGQASATQSAYGAIPGVDEAKALPLVARVAARGAVTGIGNAGAQAVQNTVTKQPLNKNLGNAAATGAVAGIVSPAVERILALPFKGAANIGGKIMKPLLSEAQKKLAQAHFGLKAAENPQVAALADKNPMQSAANVKKELANSADKVAEFLGSIKGNVNHFKNRLQEAAESVPGATGEEAKKYTDWLDRELKKIQPEVKPTPKMAGVGQSVGNSGYGTPRYKKIQTDSSPGGTGSSINELPLNIFDQIKSKLGVVYQTDPIARNMYHAARNFITDNIDKTEANRSDETNKLWSKESSLIKADNNVSKLENARQEPSVSTPSVGNLSPVIPPLFALAQGNIPMAGLISAGEYAASHPQTAQAIGNKLEKFGGKLETPLQNLFRQIGLRL